LNTETLTHPTIDDALPGYVVPDTPNTSIVASSPDSELYGLINGEKITPQRQNPELYYGTDKLTWGDIVEQGGLPQRGDNRDLVAHVKGAYDSAFIGTTKLPATEDGQGAAAWAGEGGLVLEIDGRQIPGYDLNWEMEK
jgi:hypothetical protein